MRTHYCSTLKMKTFYVVVCISAVASFPSDRLEYSPDDAVTDRKAVRQSRDELKNNLRNFFETKADIINTSVNRKWDEITLDTLEELAYLLKKGIPQSVAEFNQVLNNSSLSQNQQLAVINELIESTGIYRDIVYYWRYPHYLFKGVTLLTEMIDHNERKKLLVVVGATIVTYNTIRYLVKWYRNRKSDDFVPIGRIKELNLFPAKACAPKPMFAFYCGDLGPQAGEYHDRQFLVIDGTNNKFCTTRTFPTLVLLQFTVDNAIVTISTPTGKTVSFSKADVVKEHQLTRAILSRDRKTDGLDCGDEVSQFLSEYLNEENIRLLMYQKGMFSERKVTPQQEWWINPVPKRTDEAAYHDFAPYLITTQASLDELNARLEEPVSNLHFRPVIVVEDCAAWDEDKWSEIRIGDAELQCYMPCSRCMVTTVNPATGIKHPEMQPLVALRKFRLAPDGKLRKQFKESPIFGVIAGLNAPGYIHVGQTVYARYKPSAF